MKGYFLSLFAASALFFFIYFIPDGLFLFAVAAGTLACGALIFRLFGNREALAFLLISLVYVLAFPLEHSNTIYLQAGMLFFSLYFLWDGREKLLDVKERLWRRAADGILLFVAMVLAGAALNLALNLAGLDDGGRAIEVVQELPLYLLVFAFTVVPVAEELFFRALLVPLFGRFTTPLLGAALSSVFFGITHTAYGSITEIIGATALGLVLALYFVRKGDLLPCIIAHSLFNLASISVIKMLV
ncbi:MAG: CPBP family intramembrane glutamic endopeptidase [Candidatus Micrarchaeota archaeon]